MSYKSPYERTTEHLQAVYNRLFETIGRFKDSYVAGGAIASLILKQDVNDYDIWFENLAAWQTATDLARAAKKSGLLATGLWVETDFALTFKLKSGEVIQMVKSRIGDPETVVESFDFRHAQAYFLPADPEQGLDEDLVYVGQNSEQIVEDKILLFDGVLDYPIHTLSRLQKFALRGYQVPDSTIASLIVAIRNADPELIQRDIRAVGARYSIGAGQALKYTTIAGSKTPAPRTKWHYDEEPDFDTDGDLS